MKNKLPALPISAALSAALILSSCGKQEAVGDVPSSEELAKQADEASKAIRDEAAASEAGDDAAPVIDSSAMTSYANALRGFTVMVPKNWVEDPEASDDNGKQFNAPETNATLTVGWIENREDADLQAAVKALEDAGDSISGDYVDENEYRAIGTLNETDKTAQRLLRKADGTMVQAIVTYPTESAEALDPLAKQMLDSLTLQ